MADVLYINDNKVAKALLKNKPDKVFTFRGELYYPVILKGSPQNLFLNVKKGVPLSLGEGFDTIFSWDGDLLDAIRGKKIYDFSEHYKPGEIIFDKEWQFLAERYVLPYLGK